MWSLQTYNVGESYEQDLNHMLLNYVISGIIVIGSKITPIAISYNQM